MKSFLQWLKNEPKTEKTMLNYRVNLEDVDNIANACNYERIDHQVNIGMASYQKGITRINIYLTKMTVCTYIDHPKTGKNQLFRKNVDLKTLRKIFENPRVHTGKGYRKN